MKTLYDLLGALAEDDADGIRAAFRKAARANHPDNNPDDMDAPLRFRRIVRANAILSDRRQREAYDRMLAIALRQRASKPKRGNFSRRFRELAFGAISGAIFSAVSIGIYLLFGHMSAVSLARNPVPDALVNAPAAAITAGPSGDLAGHHATTGLAGAPKVQAEIKQASRHALEESSQQEAAKKPEAGPAEAITPGAEPAVPSPSAPPATDAADAKNDGPPQDAVVKDARYYRERGIQAYRSGDCGLR
jgi:curved DNA-binding protein CbpA